MKIRALQTAQINLPQVGQPYDPNHRGGVLLVNGPTLSDDGTVLVPGQTVEVPDDFVVNRDVWEVVTPPAKGGVRWFSAKGEKTDEQKPAAAGA